MGLFSDLKTDGHEEVQDRLGGFQRFETDVHAGTIKVAYAGKADSGAQSVTLVLDLGGKEYRETIYITDKAGKNYYVPKDDTKKKNPLPGFTTINDLCLVTTDKPLAEQATEEKMVNIWNRDQKKELPTSVPVLTELTGQAVLVAIDKILENKNSGAPDFTPIADTREVNAINKVFHPTMRVTVGEATRGKTEGEFIDQWIDANKGKVRDKREIKDGSAGQSGRPGKPAGGPPQAGAKSEPRKSLFGQK